MDIEGERYEYEMNVLLYCAENDIRIEEMSIETIYHDSKNSAPASEPFGIHSGYTRI